MDVRELDFEGHYQDQDRQFHETLSLVAPGSELEQELLSWAILPHPETVAGDSARRDYTFTYELDQHIDRGLYRLRITATDASEQHWVADIAAGLISTVGVPEENREAGFIPMWFISDHLHFKPHDRQLQEHYPGHAFGRLQLGDPNLLPHRRLFGAAL